MEFTPEEDTQLPIVTALNSYFYFLKLPVFVSLQP